MSLATCTQEEFMQKRQQWQRYLTGIIIPDDINAQVAKSILSQLDIFYSNVRLEFIELEVAKERMESVIREYERSRAIGKNEDERKRNATESLQNYDVGNGETMNVYDHLRQICGRYSTLKGYLDVVSAKQSRLVTATGLLKIEKELGHGTF